MDDIRKVLGELSTVQPIGFLRCQVKSQQMIGICGQSKCIAQAFLTFLLHVWNIINFLQTRNYNHV